MVVHNFLEMPDKMNMDMIIKKTYFCSFHSRFWTMFSVSKTELCAEEIRQSGTRYLCLSLFIIRVNTCIRLQKLFTSLPLDV